MATDRKTAALLATATAYYERGEWLQYDQYSMDRLLRVSSRRRKYAPPEAATEQSTLFLDCSSFVWAAYYQTFGYELEADITWEMLDLVRPRVFYREFTHLETAKERLAIADSIRALLRAGDVMVWTGGGNGHAMLYIGDGRFMNCTQGGVAAGYDYEGARDRMKPNGAMLIEDVELLLTPSSSKAEGRNYIFAEQVERFGILRPLDRIGAPLLNAEARLSRAAKLKLSTLTDFPCGRTAPRGGDVTYTVKIENLSEGDAEADIAFAPPDGAILADGAASVTLALTAGQTAETGFRVHIPDSFSGAQLPSPVLTVNGMKAYAPPVCVGFAPSPACEDTVKMAALGKIIDGERPYIAAKAAYAKAGIALPDTPEGCLARLFSRHDSIAGPALSRRKQRPEGDLAAYSLFGGRSVITPEAGDVSPVRTARMLARDLQAGDILLISCDAVFSEVRDYFYDGKRLFGALPDMLAGEALDGLMEALFAEACFIVLRPFGLEPSAREGAEADGWAVF